MSENLENWTRPQLLKLKERIKRELRVNANLMRVGKYIRKVGIEKLFPNEPEFIAKSIKVLSEDLKKVDDLISKRRTL